MTVRADESGGRRTEGALRERLCDAAAELVTTVGWGRVTMARLAEVVGVSRQTVYNEIGTKNDLAEAVVLRELDRFLAGVTAAFDAHPGLAAVVEGGSPDDTAAASRAAVLKRLKSRHNKRVSALGL